VPAGDFDDVAVSPDLLSRAVVPAVILGRIDQTIGQDTTAGQGAGYPIPGGRKVLLGVCLAGPADREALTEHGLVGFGPGKPLLGQLSAMLVAIIANGGDGTVPVTNDL
jgi:hypothetical protein